MILETLGALAPGQIVAGASALLGLGAIALAQAARPPGPCWTRSGCDMKAADPDACMHCAVYQRAKISRLELQSLPELGEVRRLSSALGD